MQRFIEDYNVNLQGISRGDKWQAKRMTDLFALKVMKIYLLEDDYKNAKACAKEFEEFEKYFYDVNA
jgi:hypothetical protein